MPTDSTLPLPPPPSVTNISVTQATDPAADPPKPGVRTTEFWLSLLAMLLGTFVTSGLLPDASVPVKIAGMALAALAVLGYGSSRAQVKAAFHRIVPLLLLPALALSFAACACTTPAQRNDAVCVLERHTVDCTVAEVTAVAPQFLPVLGTLVGFLTGEDGTVDWDRLGTVAAGMGLRDGGCILAELLSDLENPSAGPTAGPKAIRKVKTFRDGFEMLRRTKYGGASFRLPGGKVI